MRQHEMHTLTQGIVSSHRARSSALASLREQAVAQRREAQGHLRDLGTARQAAAGEQRVALSRGRAELLKVRASLGAAEGRRRSGVRGWLKVVANDRQAAAGEQRAALSRGRAELLKVRPSLRSVGRQRRSAIQGWLKVVTTARQAAAGEQRAALSRGRAELAEEKPRLRMAERQRRSAIQGWLKVVATDRAAAHREWHDTVSALRAGGVGTVAVAEAPRPVTSAAPAEESGEDELATLSSRVFDYLASHLNGTRLTEIEQELGMGRFQAARVVRHLTEDGKVEKRDLLYYAI